MSKIALNLLATTIVAVAAGGAMAQEVYPAKPIRLVVNIAAGGPVDATARLFAAFLSERVRQPVVVENRAGGASLIGTREVANAAPDGYTLLVSTSSLPTYEAFVKSPGVNVLDLTYISLLRRTPLIIGSTPRFSSLAELIAQAKARPGDLKFGSYGNAITIYTHTLNEAAGIRAQMIPYKGLADAATAIARGEIDYVLTNDSALRPHVASGRARFLAVAASERTNLLPDVPSAPEAGLKDADVSTWAGLLGPRGLAPAVVKRLYGEVVAFTRDEASVKSMRQLGFEPVNVTPEQFKALVQREIAMFNRGAKSLGIQPE